MFTRILRLLSSIWYQLTSSQYRLLQKSGLLDPDYYLDNYPDVAASGVDPLTHYLRKGFAEHRQPGPLFDHEYYRHQVPELKEKVDNPLVHFLEEGRYQGLKANFLVDPEYYACVSPDFDNKTMDSLSHFLQKGGKDAQACSLSPYFDVRFYCNKYVDARKHLDDPRAAYIDFLSDGVEENRQPSAFFDSAFYLDKNPVLKKLGLDPLRHYGKFGAENRRSPSPLFDPIFYENKYGVTNCDDLYAHFLKNTLQEDLQPCSWFDPVFYRQTYLSEAENPILPLKHFLEIGFKNHYYPNKDVANLAEKPVISILVPVYNIKISHLNNCIRSVLNQSYPHWEICLVDDCSTDGEIRQVLTDWAASDLRIKIDFLAENSGISAATNVAAGLASGSYLTFLDNDDELAPEALYTFATWLNKNPGELYYSDESLISEDGRQLSVFRKPSFNRELLLSHNYVTHGVLTQKTLFDQVGGCAEEFNGAQDHDLFFKLSEAAKTIIHIPKVLYYWRASATSTSINHDEKHYANDAGRKSVDRALARWGQTGKVELTDWKFFYRAKRPVQVEFSTTIVISWEKPEDGIIEWVTNLITSTGHKVSQLILLMTQQPSDSLVDTISTATGIETVCKVVADDLRPSAKLNSVLAGIESYFVTFVSGDLNIISDDWLAALVEFGQFPEFGIVSGRIEYPDEYYNSLTSVPNTREASPVYYNHFLTNCSVFMNGRHCQQEVLMTSSDLFLIRNELLQSEGGLDSTHFPHLFALTDLSLRLHQQGWKNIYTPHCKATTNINDLTRHRQCPVEALQEEKMRFQNKWFEVLNCGDPFYNPGVLSDKDLCIHEYPVWLAGPQPSLS